MYTPHDVQSMKMEEPTQQMWVSRSSVGAPSTALTPPESEIRKMAEILNAGKKVAMLVGHGANGATDEVLAVAEKTGAGIVTALRGKQVVPSDVPYHTQQLGLLGSLPSRKMMQGCDTLLMLGSNYPYGQFLPATDQARGIQVDLRPSHLGMRYPMELNMWGDVKSTLQALLPHLEQKDDKSWQSDIAAQMKDWDNVLDAVADVKADPVNPRKVFIELNKRLPDNAIVTYDAGSTADWYGHHIRLRRGMMGDLSGLLATMLAAMPAHISAEFVVNTAEALLKGDPDEIGVVAESAKSLVAEGVQKVKNALHIGSAIDDPNT